MIRIVTVMSMVDFSQKFRDGIIRIKADILANNAKGCFNNSMDLTRTSEFIGFDEGIFIGEVLEGIFENLRDMLRMYQYNKTEIEPIRTEIIKMLDILVEKFPPKNDKAKVEIYDSLCSARAYITHQQLHFYREKKIKRSPPESSLE